MTKRDLNNPSPSDTGSPASGLSYRFSKSERLSRKKIIDRLFFEKQFVKAGGISIWYQFGPYDFFEENHPAQCLFAVPKRNMPLAVDRNRMKRRLREAYRHLKEEKLYPFLRKNGQQLALAILFQQRKEASFTELNQLVSKALDQIISRYEKP